MTTKVRKSSPSRGAKPGERRAGRRKGTPNKVTRDVRQAIALIAQRNVSRFEEWLAETAREDPHKAATLFLQVIEYHIPKLARTEMTGKDGVALIPPVLEIMVMPGRR